MTWTLIVWWCTAVTCHPIPLPSPGAGYTSERACNAVGRAYAEERGAATWTCRPRMGKEQAA